MIHAWNLVRTRRGGSALVALAAAMALSPGCETAPSSLGQVNVVYRFENVRQTAGLDEWTSIRQILNRHATKPVTGEMIRTSTNAGVRVSTYQAAALLPGIGALDAIQSDLETLSQNRVGGSRIAFSLAGLNATYRSNVVAAGVEVTVAGVAMPGHIVRVYQDAATPVETKVNRSGNWSVRLSVVPEESWVYGMSIDPSGRMAARHFRVDLNTRRQEDLDEAEFTKGVPKAGITAAPATPGPDAARREPSEDRDDAEWRKRRAAEDDAIRKQRASEDPGRP